MAGNSDIIEIMRQSLVDYTAGVFTPVQFAAAKALEIYYSSNIPVFQSQKYQRRRDVVLSFLTEIGWDFFKPLGGLYVWAKPPVDNTVPFVTRLFEHTGVLLTPGAAYGPKGSKYLRISLVHEENILKEAFKRIKNTGSILYSNPDSDKNLRQMGPSFL